jgi:KipI family sensor histidine kinase inhibitor
MTPSGDDALLVDLGAPTAGELHAAAAAVRVRTGAVCVAGHSSVLVIGDVSSSEIATAVRSAIESPIEAVRPAVHTIGVDFSPDYALDLREVAERAGMATDELVQRLMTIRFRARYLGFRAGFAYLDGIPSGWTVPRRATSREHVPAGSFAIAAGMAGFYPEDSPGGWNLLGRTSEKLWDPWRAPPATIVAGDEITVVAAPFRESHAQLDVPRSGGRAIARVTRAGQMTLVVGGPDDERYRWGIAPGGAFDAELAAAANAAVGNRPDAKLLECTLVGPELVFDADAAVAWRGPDTSLQLDEELLSVSDARRFIVRAGSALRIGRIGGVRGWLAIAGALADPGAPFAVSPYRLRSGDQLDSADSGSPGGTVELSRAGDPHLLGAIAGPHFAGDGDIESIERNEWTVTPAIDRVGVRLRSDRGAGAASGDLASCGLHFGNVQWHPNGELVIMGPEHPVTGGYLLPLTLRSSERWKLAQLAPGARVRFAVERRSITP